MSLARWRSATKRASPLAFRQTITRSAAWCRRRATSLAATSNFGVDLSDSTADVVEGNLPPRRDRSNPSAAQAGVPPFAYEDDVPVGFAFFKDDDVAVRIRLDR